jgi:phage terminase small subunit
MAKSRRATLSIREAAFVRHLLAGKPGVRGIALRASIAAGYSARAAGSCSHELLKKPGIQAAIAAYHARADITVDRVLEEFRRIAFSDMRDIASWGGQDGVKLKQSDTLSDEAAAAISEVVDHSKSRIELGGGGDKAVATEILDRHVRVKLHDKMAALTTLAKHLGMLREPEPEKDRPLFPRGFFAALITGDPSKLEDP